ncbi:MAG TPA: TOBE domain-containing protein, partial [bacterium]
IRVGETVTLSFRPEDVRIGRHEGTTVTGRVLHASYLGAVTDYAVESAGMTLRIHEGGGALRGPGEEITVTLPATAAIVHGQ